MTFAEISEGKVTVTVDGYSNFKTKKAAIRDLGRFIRDNVNNENCLNRFRGLKFRPLIFFDFLKKKPLTLSV